MTLIPESGRTRSTISKRKTNPTRIPINIEWLRAAITGPHVDIRKSACELLIKQRTVHAQELLAEAIHDQDNQIRMLALKSLIATGDSDRLALALESQYIGVRLATATALARHGDSRAKDVLLSVVDQPWPEAEHDRAVQKELVESALDGLVELSDPSTLKSILQKTADADKDIRQAAAKALQWIVTDESMELVRPLLQHEDADVQSAAAIAMSLAEDPVASNYVFSNSDNVVVANQLLAAVAAGNDGERQLVRLMDGNRAAGNAAFLIMLFRDWMRPGDNGSAARMVACLGVRDPRLRFLAACGLQAYRDTDEFSEFVSHVVNDRGDHPAWTISRAAIESIAKSISFGPPKLAARITEILLLLARDKQGPWDQAWNQLQNRFGTGIDDASKTKIAGHGLNKKDAESLDQLVFGTLVGLAREQGGSHHRYGQAYFGRAVFQIRCAAIKRLQQLAQTAKSFLEPAISVVTHTCTDPIAEVRTCAFSTLAELGVDDTTRARIGIDSGHLDLGKLGLDLLGGSSSAKDRQAMLKRTVLSRTDAIAIEAADRLKQEIGVTKVNEICFDSPNTRLHKLSVTWLGEDYDNKPAAVKRLRYLAKNTDDPVRSRAISVLVDNKDQEIFGIIGDQFKNEPPQEHGPYYKWLQKIGDAQTPEYLVALLTQPGFETNTDRLLTLAASFRDKAIAPGLLELFKTVDYKDDLVSALTTISGFDQPIEDENDLLSHRDWMQGQHPRDGETLAKLLEAVIDFGPSKQPYSPDSISSVVRDSRGGWTAFPVIGPPRRRDSPRRSTSLRVPNRKKKRGNEAVSGCLGTS